MLKYNKLANHNGLLVGGVSQYSKKTLANAASQKDLVKVNKAKVIKSAVTKIGLSQKSTRKAQNNPSQRHILLPSDVVFTDLAGVSPSLTKVSSKCSLKTYTKNVRNQQ